MVKGWRIASYFGDSAFYNGTWLLRAAAAKAEFMTMTHGRPFLLLVKLTTMRGNWTAADMPTR
jgi:hypothetical protein